MPADGPPQPHPTPSTPPSFPPSGPHPICHCTQRGKETSPPQICSVIRRGCVSLVLMRSLAAAVEKCLRGPDNSWGLAKCGPRVFFPPLFLFFFFSLSVQVRALTLVLEGGGSDRGRGLGCASTGSQRLFACFPSRAPHLLYPLCGGGPPRAVPSEGDLKRAAAGERVPFPPAVTNQAHWQPLVLLLSPSALQKKRESKNPLICI